MNFMPQGRHAQRHSLAAHPHHHLLPFHALTTRPCPHAQSLCSQDIDGGCQPIRHPAHETAANQGPELHEQLVTLAEALAFGLPWEG
jgi:hypothetical protein